VGLLHPDPADVNFHLADALYRGGRLESAVERYFCAVEWAPDFIEAWAQLGCLQAELDELEAAEESLRQALAIHPSNPDVLLSFAQLLDRQGRESEGVEYWRQYLQFDTRGPWAEHARMRVSQDLPWDSAEERPLEVAELELPLQPLRD